MNAKMKNRETELDILRLLAMLAVIWVHVGGMETDSLPTSDPNCQWLIFLKSIMTWEIPVYVMISGRFFLDPDREMPFSKIRKAILRLVIAFVVWNIVYQTYYILTDSYTGLNWKGILSQALIGPYHFWYLYMIIGLYLITPFLRKIAESKQLMEYYLLLAFAFSLLTKYGPSLPYVGSTIGAMLSSMSMNFVIGYAGYYILGYYLHKFSLPAKWERPLYFSGIAFVLLGALANTWQSVQGGVYSEWFTTYTAPNTAIIASALYTFFVKRVGRFSFTDATNKWINRLSVCSFGVYLIHALVLDVLKNAGLMPTMLHPLVMMPVITLIGFSFAAIIVVIIRKIPYVGRKIT